MTSPFAPAATPAADSNPFAGFGGAPAPAAPAQAYAPAPAAAPAGPFAAPAQAYAQPAQAYAPATGAPMAAPAGPVADDAWSAAFATAAQPPKPISEFTKLSDIAGRLVIVAPFKCDRNVPDPYDAKRIREGQKSKPFRDELHCDVVVLDGGPLGLGGDLTAQPPRPHTKTVAIPHVIADMLIVQGPLVTQFRDALALREQGQPGFVVGRFAKGGAPNDPWRIDGDGSPQARDLTIGFLRQWGGQLFAAKA